MEYACDVLVIGGGGAAVRAALEAAGEGAQVIMVDKGRFERSGSSPLALHGLATPLHEDDSEEMLFDDIVRTGCGINDRDLVRLASQESTLEPGRLEDLGVQFVRTPAGGYEFYRGAGHSRPRGLNLDETANGINFVAVLGKEAWKRGVRLLEGVMIVELLTEDGRVAGAVGVDALREVHAFAAAAVVLAAGGANRAYPNVVPRIAHEMYRTTGDAFALALNAGLSLVDMEFVNFRDSPPAARLGGVYRNKDGEAFMDRYDPERRERAPRGLVVEAIYREMREGRGPVYLDIDRESPRVAQFLPPDYRAYVKACEEGSPPPVTITFQRLLGGVRIAADASTEISGLYAAGESTGGFHGADRMQAAAFLETQVFGRLAGINAARFARAHGRAALSKGKLGELQRRLQKITKREKGAEAAGVRHRIQQITWDHASIVRDAEGLGRALDAIRNLREETDGAVGRTCIETLEVRNLHITAEALIRSALAREESRGTHRRSDFPHMDESLDGRHVCVSLGEDGGWGVMRVESRA